MKLEPVKQILSEWWGARPRLSELTRLPRWELATVAVVALAAAVSTALVWSQPLNADAASQVQMARSLSETGQMRTEQDFSRFYPPLYPLLLILPGVMLGFNAATVHLVQAILRALLAGSAYVVARRFGAPVAGVAAVLTVFDPVLLSEAGDGRATLLSALLLTWTFHFSVGGISRPATLGWAGLAAGLLYLTKDTTGYIALVGIAIGFLWRVRAEGFRRVVSSPHYQLAGLFFVACYGLWGLRNLVRFGSPIGNEGIVRYTVRFFTATDPGTAAVMVGGTLALLLAHWLGWIWPAVADPRAWIRFRRGSLRLWWRPEFAALALFLGVTLLLSSIMAAIFMRNEGNKTFPDAVPYYFRLIAAGDVLLFTGVGLAVCARVVPALRAGRDRWVAAAKVVVIAAMLAAQWPAVAAQASQGSQGYHDLDGYLASHGVRNCYSEAANLLRTNLPEYLWSPVALNFTGPFLDYAAAGVPDGATIVTVGWTDAPDYRAAGYDVILSFNRSNPPVVRNPFYAP